MVVYNHCAFSLQFIFRPLPCFVYTPSKSQRKDNLAILCGSYLKFIPNFRFYREKQTESMLHSKLLAAHTPAVMEAQALSQILFPSL